MDLDYDQKFEEMKQYIPFLESMIKRLESTNNGVNNPRKAQLDKIRSLRDLLLDKKKRMKMENLLKCEQVLVNLYAKVEQRDSMTSNKEECSERIKKEASELKVVRNKLKSVVSKLQVEDPETLPEIARASNTEVVCTPGSKEPALFQRRPHKISPQRVSPRSHSDDNISSSKRHYTRVLLSPERKKKEWPTNSDNDSEKPLYSRRLPRRSPRRHSPSYKKERKKSSRQRSESNEHSKDFNITLKVPEERLRSLNTKDILSRIIHCNDNDVDIDTLRGLRSQILGELKQTGSKDDISDLILKSYKKKEKQTKSKDEIEEGELSDSESEAIENIYGSLVVVNEGESNSFSNQTSSDKNQPKKIQICLVINSDKEIDGKIDSKKFSEAIDVTDFEDYSKKKALNSNLTQKKNDNIIEQISEKEVNQKENNPVEELKINSPLNAQEEKEKSKQENLCSKTEDTKNNEENESRGKSIAPNEPFQPNFYQPLIEEKTNHLVKNQSSCNLERANDIQNTKTTGTLKDKEENKNIDSSDMKKDAFSQIEILQALKNEILSETSIVPVSETVTPALHQPKITKVARALDIAPKKRISIENYKQKSVISCKQPLFNSSNNLSFAKDENLKKQSLKLTEKECERFNLPVDVSPVNSSEDEENSNIDVDFTRGDSTRKSIYLVNSAPKSPDHEDFADTGIKPPVIIPIDPVKNVVAIPKVDIDMRTLIPSDGKRNDGSPLISGEIVFEATWKEKSNMNQSGPTECSDGYAVDTDRLSRSSVSYPNATTSISSNATSNIPALMSLPLPQMTPPVTMVPNVNPILNPLLNTKLPLLSTPNLAPNMAPNILPNMNTGLPPNMMNMNPSMTPSRMMPSINPIMTPIMTPNARSYEMTPRPNFDDDYTNQKHVYAPIFPAFEPHDYSEKDNLNTQRCNNINRNDRYQETRLGSPHTRMECPSTPNPSFGRMECPSTPNPSFGRMECPSTPNPSFGRMECPPTPNPSFGRMECPLTPNPSFGRLECPSTPNPSFGRMECPSTPNPSFGRLETSMHAFGRSDCQMTNSHSFGRTDPNRTPTSAFGRNDYHHKVPSYNHKYSQDPRLNRNSDYDKYHGRNDERHRSYVDDDYNCAENSNKFRRTHGKSYEQAYRRSRDSLMSRRESSIGRCLPDKDYDESYSKDNHGNDCYYRRERFKTSDDRRRDYNEKSMVRRYPGEGSFSRKGERSRSYAREDSMEKPISVQSHTGRSFNIDTSFNRTFQDTKSSSFTTSFDDRRRRASSVGRSLRKSNYEDLEHISNSNTAFGLDLPSRKTTQFRRASSVGRNLKDYNTKQNFNDIKEDLRSCKFDNYNFKMRNLEINKSKETPSNEKVKSNEHRTTEVPIACTTESKTVLHLTNRDPRKRDIDQINNDFRDNSKYSPRKNIRDPRMRREVDDRTISKDKYRDRNYSSLRYKTNGIVYSNDNIAKGTILASATGVKNFKIPKIKRPVEEKDVESKTESSKNDTKKDASVKDAKKEDNTLDVSNKVECQGRSDTSVENRRTLEKNKGNVAVTVSKSKPKEVLPSSNKTEDKAKIQVDNVSIDSMSNSCDRYITRSISNNIKSGTPSKQINNISPVRKLRRIKKPIIYDSDSDSQENVVNNPIINKTDEGSKDIDTKTNKKTVDMENEVNIEKFDSKECTDLHNSENRAALSDEKNTYDKFENAVPSVRNDLDEEQNELDLSFGVDDELFSDNIASESVLDNINALIAGLDNDIEAPKINDFNDKFIDNIVGHISSIDSTSTTTNKPDFTSDIVLNNKSEFSIAQGSNMQLPGQKNKADLSEVATINNNSDIVNVLTKPNDVQSVQNESAYIIDKAIKSVTPVIKNIDDTVIQENSSKSFSTIDSTTANDQKVDETSHCVLVNNDHSNDDSFVPDSTINLHENDAINRNATQTEISSGGANKLSEMNNDVTSTNNSVDSTYKEQSSSNPNVADDLPRIDSIGKLLSMLEDKNKIKELLTMLGKDLGDNEKIKKKLEKLSEIVSDDDEMLEENNKKENINEERPLNEGNCKKNFTEAEKLQPSDENKKLNNIKIPDKELEEEKLVISECLLEKDTAINKEDHCENFNVQEVVERHKDLAGNISLLSCEKEIVENIINDMPTNATGEGHSSKEEKVEKSLNDVENNREKDDIELGSEVKEQQNQNVDSKSSHLQTGKKTVKKSKITKRGRSRLAKKLFQNKGKRVTRSEVARPQPQNPPAVKKPSRELLKLQEDIRDMFISEDILNATGIRMCRLAKLGNGKHQKVDTQISEVEPSEPIVVLENIQSKISADESLSSLKKRGCTSKICTPSESSVESLTKEKVKHKPGPKSKTKRQEDDPYTFETDSIGESNNTVDTKDEITDSESDLASTKSFESSELLVESKKTSMKRRKRRNWQLGVIKKKGVKNKSSMKYTESCITNSEEVKGHKIDIPNFNYFTDKTYCFDKNIKIYLCCLCGYRGNDIVPHFKEHHPHSEVPLSRLNPATAKEAIEQCENMNLQAVSKIHTEKYVCRFCFQEFRKSNTALESFFWHVVSMHTGEYKKICSECINVTRCPFHLDIPPPPKNLKGQLIGYICGRCNFTQISLENLKTHVIVRHDDEQTEVYSINLGQISSKLLNTLISKVNKTSIKGPRILRSSRSNQSVTEPSDDCSDIIDDTDRVAKLDTAQDKSDQDINKTDSPKISVVNKIQSKLIFENDDLSDVSSYSKNDEVIRAGIKVERDDDTQDSTHNDATEDIVEPETETVLEPEPEPEPVPESEPIPKTGPELPHNDRDKNAVPEIDSRPTDVFDLPHFKIKISNTGTKEYVCCINGIDHHYKTTLLISFKKHVQLKHPESWDGYCFVCKVIVTAQGKHKFKDCLQHFLDKHIDNFPILEETPEPSVNDTPEPALSSPIEAASKPKEYVTVRPLSDLISPTKNKTDPLNSSMPQIHSVVSLGASTDSLNCEPQKIVKVCDYEKTQNEVMTKKHRVVLETMLTPEKLIQIFKCAGRFCSYTTDNAEEALLHASTHQKIGGENSMRCAYCDFDSSGNAIDLVMHVFKNYSHCSYACSKCFYRAAGSQLVYAHVKRIHTDTQPDLVAVLSSATCMKDNTKDDLLHRDAAVLYYVCNNRDSDDGNICQFKTYILTKFREHLQTKHANDPEYSCYMCNVTTPSSKLLAQHLKSHGLRIYQCCRCLFGADNEAELTAHASEKHPFKQPKAYLRIITTKGGSSEVRVLPLAVLSKSTVETTVVTPSGNEESPVKQAERSIDLENLIGHTNFVIKSMSTITNAATIEPVDITASETQKLVQSEQASCSTSLSETDRTSPATLTLLEDTNVENNEPRRVVKSELISSPTPETNNETQPPQLIEIQPAVPSTTLSDNDVVCLDSDDESSRQSIIDLSCEDMPGDTSNNPQDSNSYIKLPRSRLYKCNKCSLLCKGEGLFKRHIMSCFPNPNEIMKCAYCSYITNAKLMLNHYNNFHLQSTVQYTCAVCNGKFPTLTIGREHMNLIHNESSTIVKSKKSAGLVHYILEIDVKARKRKLSSDNSTKNSEPPAKLKKFGPQDIDKLPINPIMDNFVFCSLCGFNTKVRINMVRHLQMHTEQQPVPRTAPVNPVPHLESNEKHFDKMVNLASSSINTLNKSTKESNVIATEYLSPDAASIYPKYVSDRVRYTCGAKDCAYISVNEMIFKIHWETLHSGTTDYHCVHCPSHQFQDTSKPLTVMRIISHLKMHDAKLYACSSCTFYHYSRKIAEKHLKEVHSGKLIIVREEGVPTQPAPPPTAVQSASAPTMDLKPWQCGLCKFKSMLCQEVIAHCGKFHQSKMQFKCTYCGFRTSNIENISKHQSKQHPGKKEEVFFFYYREGSIPDEPDGTPLWQKQSQKNEPEIKTEIDVTPTAVTPKVATPPPPKAPTPVNLDLVKKEVVEPVANLQNVESIEELCKEFGQFCEPNGLKYKCSLCKVVVEDTNEAMRSHLYEELQYRKWGCSVCSYKAFHKPGLQMHVQTEHSYRREAQEPIELQLDLRIETWVTNLIEHQTTIINRNKENLAKQKAEILRASPGTSAKVVEKPQSCSTETSGETLNVTMVALEKMFGSFGVPTNMNYTCPKCNTSARSEAVMREHLEAELNKIRWYCPNCGESFQTYHEAQFHCRSVHQGQSSRPMEVTKNVGLRHAWVSAALRVQKLSMNYIPITETPQVDTPAQPANTSSENSLLAVLYEEKVPTPEEQMKLNKKTTEDNKANKTQPSSTVEAEPTPTNEIYQCQYCCATYKYENFYQAHVLKHFGLKPFTCPYCPYTDQKKSMEMHIYVEHPNRSVVFMNTPIPSMPPMNLPNCTQTPVSKSTAFDTELTQVCLVCEEEMVLTKNHYHDGVRPQFGVKGTIVHKCWICLTLHKPGNDFNQHYKQFHAKEKKKISFYKLVDNNTRSQLYCALCKMYFAKLAQYRVHHQELHSLSSVSAQPESSNVIELDDEQDTGRKRKAEDSNMSAVKRVAKKSTTKLPYTMAVARKSTTKLPYDAVCEDEEYSFYGTRPSMDNLENVTTLMPFCNTFVPFTLKKLNEIINIHPIVSVKDISCKK